jgi:hypothetical protein
MGIPSTDISEGEVVEIIRHAGDGQEAFTAELRRLMGSGT